MAKEIVIWCDRHLDNEERVPSKEYRLGRDGRWFTLDLCDQCAAEVVAPLTALLESHGVVLSEAPKPARKQAGKTTAPVAPATLVEAAATSGVRKGMQPAGDREWQCLWCPLDYAGASGFRTHIKASHGISGLVEAFGDTCPLCNSTHDSLAGHIARHHPDLPNTSQAFIRAREQGDPHGIVHEREQITETLPVGA